MPQGEDALGALSLEHPMSSHFTPRNKGKLVGQKAPLRLSDIWSIRPKDRRWVWRDDRIRRIIAPPDPDPDPETDDVVSGFYRPTPHDWLRP